MSVMAILSIPVLFDHPPPFVKKKTKKNKQTTYFILNEKKEEEAKSEMIYLFFHLSRTGCRNQRRRIFNSIVMQDEPGHDNRNQSQIK